MGFDVIRDDLTSADTLLAIISDPKAAAAAVTALRQARTDADTAAAALDAKAKEADSKQAALDKAQATIDKAAQKLEKDRAALADLGAEYQTRLAALDAELSRHVEAKAEMTMRETAVARREAAAEARDGVLTLRAEKLVADEEAAAASRARLAAALAEAR